MVDPRVAADLAYGIVRALCGEAWTSPPVRVVDEYPLAPSGRVILRGSPVVEVHSVEVDGEVAPAESYVVVGRILRVTDWGYLWRTGRRVAIDYTFGTDQVPGVAIRAIEHLADEIAKADSGDATCRIPERVTSVTRQGVSWTLLDPQEFLSEGRTGIYEVDLAIRALNPGKAKTRARVFSAAHPPADRRIVR